MLHVKGVVPILRGSAGSSLRQRLSRSRAVHVEQLKYEYGSPEQAKLKEAIATLLQTDTFVPSIIRRRKIYTGDTQPLKCPHNHSQLVARYYYCTRQHLEQSIGTARAHKEEWRNMDVAERAAIWRKCAELLAGPKRYELNAALMLCQAKTCAQAEEDTCALIRSLRLNADMLQQLDATKLPNASCSRVKASVQLRPLDGFVAAIAPFTSIALASKLALQPALMGNVVLFKPSDTGSVPSYVIHKAMMEAGLPRGIISFVPANARLFGDVIANSPFLGGINFIGSVASCREIWGEVSSRMSTYRCLPRLVAECGGKNFHFVHETADVDLVVDATVKAAFDYSGQKCSCCERLYVPQSLWPAIRCGLQHKTNALTVGDPCDFSTDCSAVINVQAFDRIVDLLLYAKNCPNVDVLCGGDYCKTVGYFIEPTVLLSRNPCDRVMMDQILGPVLAVYVYDNNDLDKTLQLVETTSAYAYTGSVFACDDSVICYMLTRLRMAAGNLYVNCRCSGSTDSHTPFSGNRLSSSYDNYGPSHSLLCWGAPQLIQECAQGDPASK